MRQKAVIDYFNEAKRSRYTSGHVAGWILCGNVLFCPTFDFSNNLWLMVPRFYATDLWNKITILCELPSKRHVFHKPAVTCWVTQCCIVFCCIRCSSLFPLPPAANHSLTQTIVFCNVLLNFHVLFWHEKMSFSDKKWKLCECLHGNLQ